MSLFDSDGVEAHIGQFHSWQEDSFESCTREVHDRVRFKAPDALVCEGFVIRSNTSKLDAGAFSLTTDLIGACRLLAHQAGIPFVRQTPAEAKSFATDDKLRRLGWYRPTKGGHANDASRHLLTFLAKQNYSPILQALTAETPLATHP